MLAVKHKIDVDKISEIISDWDDWKGKNLYFVAVRKVRSKSKNYTKILRVFCPIDFYWIGDKFDGCGFDISKCRVSRHQEKLIDEILEVIEEAMKSGLKPSDIPRAIKKEFGERL